MAHGANIISQIKLPNGTAYEIHDANAIHNAEDLGLSAVLVFKGTKDTDAEITSLTSAKVGDVWLSKATNVEYVCITAVNGTANADAWEKLGNIHNAASSTHTHNVTVTGTNEASTVTGTVTIPTVSTTTRYIGASASAPTVTDNSTSEDVLGGDTTITVSGGTPTKRYIAASVSGTAVGANGTANAITGFGTHTTAKAITELNTTEVQSMSSAGALPSWNASVSDGVLSITWGAGSLPSATKTTVVTGSKTTANAITALGTPTTAAALTGVKVTSQPTITLATSTESGTGKAEIVTDVSSISVGLDKEVINAVTDVNVTVGAPAISLSAATTTATGKVGVISSASIGSTSASIINGIAAAQRWTQTSGITGTPNDTGSVAPPSEEPVVVSLTPGLYNVEYNSTTKTYITPYDKYIAGDIEGANSMLVRSWDDITSSGDITVNNNIIRDASFDFDVSGKFLVIDDNITSLGEVGFGQDSPIWGPLTKLSNGFGVYIPNSITELSINALPYGMSQYIVADGINSIDFYGGNFSEGNIHKIILPKNIRLHWDKYGFGSGQPTFIEMGVTINQTTIIYKGTTEEWENVFQDCTLFTCPESHNIEECDHAIDVICTDGTIRELGTLYQ